MIYTLIPVLGKLRQEDLKFEATWIVSNKKLQTKTRDVKDEDKMF